jgi:hypothetical protein
MRHFIIAVVVVGCAGGQRGVETRADRPPRAERSAVTSHEPPSSSEVAKATREQEDGAPFTSAPRFSEADQTDQAFIVNARRAISEYRSFIEKAGETSEYAEAVKRSRERIADLEQMIVWVEQGRNTRDMD